MLNCNFIGVEVTKIPSIFGLFSLSCLIMETSLHKISS